MLCLIRTLSLRISGKEYDIYWKKGAFVPGPKNREISNSTRTAGSGELPHHVME